MIIGIDASRANTERRTGPGWYSFHLIKELSKIDKDNEYILYSNRPLIGDLSDLGSTVNYKSPTGPEYDKHGYQVIRSPHGNFKGAVLRWPFRFFWTLGRFSLEMLIRKPDILFVPAHSLPYFHPRRSVNTIHDIGFEIDRRLYKSEMLGPEGSFLRVVLESFVRVFTLGRFGSNSKDYMSWATRYSLRRSRKIIVPSQYTKDDLIKVYGADEKKITVIPNGYDSSAYFPNKGQMQAQKILNNYEIKKPYLLYVGRLETKKNTNNLVEAFGIYKEHNKGDDHKLVLVGSASFGYDEVKYLIFEYGLDYDVIIPGYIPEKDLPYIYNEAEAFIFPSKYEGFGIPLLHAMACGIPIAASHAASIPEVLQNSALFFDPENPHSIAQAMRTIIKDRGLRQDLSHKGSERIKDFSWSKTAKATLELILNVK